MFDLDEAVEMVDMDDDDLILRTPDSVALVLGEPSTKLNVVAELAAVDVDAVVAALALLLSSSPPNGDGCCKWCCSGEANTNESVVRGYTSLPSRMASVSAESLDTRMPDSTSSSGPGRFASFSFRSSARRARFSSLHRSCSDGAAFESFHGTVHRSVQVCVTRGKHSPGRMFF